jgi:hypothetical protein
VKTFIENLLPLKYLVSRSNAVKNYRLRGNKTVDISFEEVLSKPFFTGEKNAPILIPIPKKPTIIRAPPKPMTPVNQKAAMARAVAMMRATPQKRKVRK